jgi:hypothetical protein
MGNFPYEAKSLHRFHPGFQHQLLFMGKYKALNMSMLMLPLLNVLHHVLD